MRKTKYYVKYAERHNMPQKVSFEELEAKMEQEARNEEADSVILAEDKIND